MSREARVPLQHRAKRKAGAGSNREYADHEIRHIGHRCIRRVSGDRLQNGGHAPLNHSKLIDWLGRAHIRQEILSAQAGSVVTRPERSRGYQAVREPSGGGRIQLKNDPSWHRY